VDFETLVFTASMISGHFSSAIIVFTVLFALSVGFSCEVYGVVNCCLVQISSRKLLKILLVNCTPLSVMTTFGTPYLAIMRSMKPFFMDSDVAFRSGTNSVYLENRSISTSSIWLPCFERGRGPTQSAHTVAHGFSGSYVSIFPGACI